MKAKKTEHKIYLRISGYQCELDTRAEPLIVHAYDVKHCIENELYRCRFNHMGDCIVPGFSSSTGLSWFDFYNSDTYKTWGVTQ